MSDCILCILRNGASDGTAEAGAGSLLAMLVDGPDTVVEIARDLCGDHKSKVESTIRNYHRAVDS